MNIDINSENDTQVDLIMICVFHTCQWICGKIYFQKIKQNSSQLTFNFLYNIKYDIKYDIQGVSKLMSGFNAL